MKNTVTLTLESCTKCPNLKTQKYYTADSWDDCTEWLCTESTPQVEHFDGRGPQLTMGGRRISIMDWNDKAPSIPKWCPLRK